MKRLPVLVGVALALVACGSPTAVGRRTAPPDVPVASVSSFRPSLPTAPTTASRTCGLRAVVSAGAPPAAATPTGQVEVLAVVYMNGVETVHLLTVQGTGVSDRVLLDGADALVGEAGHGIALVLTGKGTQLSTLDLNSGALRTIAASDGCGIGPAIMSPDGTHAAVGTRNSDNSYEIDIVDLASGAVRPLLRTGVDQYNRAGLVPISWLPSGILVTPGVWDGPSHGLMNLNPDTGALSNVTDAQVDRLSRDGRLVAAAGHVDLGDGPFNGQGLWPNHLVVGPVGASPTVVASQKDRAFYALDLENDGTLLYVKDDAPLSTATPAPDTGLYLYRNGASYQEFGEQLSTQWESAAIVGQNLALVGRQAVPGAGAAVEFDLATLCAASGCHATSKSVLTVTGDSPLAYLSLVKP